MSEENKVIKERLGERDAQGRFNDDKYVCNRIVYAKDAIIEASAGTGKTYTLQSIVLKLLLEKTITSVKNLLLVTYTEKAAGELKDKIREVLEEAGQLPSDFDEVTICTIHSFCRELLTEYAFENRVPMETEICASDKTLIHQAVHEALHSPQYREDRGADFSVLMTTAGLTADKLVDEVEKRFKQTQDMDEDAGSSNDKKKLAAAARGKLVNHLVRLANEVFRVNKSRSSAMTFDDLVERAHEVVAREAELERSGKPSDLLALIRRKYRIALVDEFQDTDKAQWDIFNGIFSHKVNKIEDGPEPKQGLLIVVGDPKQAIYSFRGADIATYLEAKHEITGGADALPLQVTYRSTPALVEAFNDIFGKKVGDDHSWFEDMKEGERSISYKDVKSPGKSEKFKFNGIDYHPDFGKPVELLESLPREQEMPKTPQSGYGKNKRCLPVFLENAAREMKRLVDLGKSQKPDYAYTTVNPDTGEVEKHSFSYSDMCILVRGHAEAAKAREILAAADIPFRHQLHLFLLIHV